jgi:aspartate aminotransferase
VQYAAIEAYAFGPDVQAYVAREREVLSLIGNAAAARLNEAGVATAAPEGGFYLFPDFAAWREQLARRGIHGSDQLCTALLEEAGVALQPDADLEQVSQPVLEGIGAINHWLAQQGQEAA